jgi:hypothetical protein
VTNGSVDLLAYIRRVVDGELDSLMTALPAIALEGPKAIGKTQTAVQRSATIHRLDDAAQYARSMTMPVLDNTFSRAPLPRLNRHIPVLAGSSPCACDR